MTIALFSPVVNNFEEHFFCIQRQQIMFLFLLYMQNTNYDYCILNIYLVINYFNFRIAKKN
jgi:hypothetical protein